MPDQTRKFFPTLIIGVGGTGSRAVAGIRRMVLKNSPISDLDDRAFVFAAVDTNARDVRALDALRPENVISLTDELDSIGGWIDHLKNKLGSRWRDRKQDIERWLWTRSRTFLNWNLRIGAGQKRMLSRAAWTFSLEQGQARSQLDDVLRKLTLVANTPHYLGKRPEIYIVTGTAGGTGSGCSLHLGRYIREFYEHEGMECFIKGILLLPDVFCGGPISAAEWQSLRANGYAYLRELETILAAHDKVTDKDVVELGLDSRETSYLPFDAAFLIDNGGLTYSGGDFSSYEQFVAQALYARIFAKEVDDGAGGAESNMIDDLLKGVHDPDLPTRRYCSFGTSCLVYPKDDVVEYLQTRLLTRLIGNDWSVVDEHYDSYLEHYRDERAKGNRSAERPIRRKYFVESVLGKREEDPFFSAIASEVVYTVQDGRTVREDEEFVTGVNRLVEQAMEDLLVIDSDDADGLEPLMSDELDSVAATKSDLRRETEDWIDRVKKAHQLLSRKRQRVEDALLHAVFDEGEEVTKQEDHEAWHLQKYLKGSKTLFGIRLFASLVVESLELELDELDSRYQQERLKISEAEEKDWDPSTEEPDDVSVVIDRLPNRHNFLTHRHYERFYESFTSYLNRYQKAIREYHRTALRRTIYQMLADALGEDRRSAGLLSMIYLALDGLKQQKARFDRHAEEISRRNTVVEDEYENTRIVYGDSKAKSELWRSFERSVSSDPAFRDECYGSLSRGIYRGWSGLQARQRNARQKQEFAALLGRLPEIAFASVKGEYDRFSAAYIRRSPDVDLDVLQAAEKEARLSGATDESGVREYQESLLADAIAMSMPFVDLPDLNSYRLLDFVVYDRSAGDTFASLLDEIAVHTDAKLSTVSDDFYGKHMIIFSRSVLCYPVHVAHRVVKGSESLRESYYAKIRESGAENIEDIVPVHIDKRFHYLIEDFDPATKIETNQAFAISLATGFFTWSEEAGEFSEPTITGRRPMGISGYHLLKRHVRANFANRYERLIAAREESMMEADRHRTRKQMKLPGMIAAYITRIAETDGFADLSEEDQREIAVIQDALITYLGDHYPAHLKQLLLAHPDLASLLES